MSRTGTQTHKLHNNSLQKYQLDGRKLHKVNTLNEENPERMWGKESEKEKERERGNDCRRLIADAINGSWHQPEWLRLRTAARSTKLKRAKTKHHVQYGWDHGQENVLQDQKTNYATKKWKIYKDNVKKYRSATKNSHRRIGKWVKWWNVTSKPFLKTERMLSAVECELCASQSIKFA